jgi:DNA-binding XRE family transcriptional regulator
MLNTRELKAEMARNGYTQKELAKKIGISEKTFISRINRGAFGTDEAEIIIKELNLSDPCKIFFASPETCQVTEAN